MITFKEFRVTSRLQRKEMALRMKKLTKSSAFKKKVQRARLKVANPAKMRIKAMKLAKQKIVNKFFPKYKDFGMAQKIRTDQIIQAKYGGAIAKIAKKVLPIIKRKELEKVKQAKAAMQKDN